MKDRLFIEVESSEGKKYLINIDNIIGIDDAGTKKITFVWLSSGEWVMIFIIILILH